MKVKYTIIAICMLSLLSCGKAASSGPSPSPKPTKTCEEALRPLVTRMMVYPETGTFAEPAECFSMSDENYRKLIIRLSFEVTGNS